MDLNWRVGFGRPLARAINRRLVLNLLRSQGAMSRAELATGIGLSPATVTFVVGDLIHEGLLIKGRPSKGATGRRPIPVEIIYSGVLTVGIKLNGSIECVLTDLATTPLVTKSLPDQTRDRGRGLRAGGGRVARGGRQPRVITGALASWGIPSTMPAVRSANAADAAAFRRSFRNLHWCGGGGRRPSASRGHPARHAEGRVISRCETIGRHLAIYRNIIDPEVIVVGGEAVAFGDPLFGPMREALARGMLWTSPTITPDWVDNSWAQGAAALATQQVFDFEASGYSNELGPCVRLGPKADVGLSPV